MPMALRKGPARTRSWPARAAAQRAVLLIALGWGCAEPPSSPTPVERDLTAPVQTTVDRFEVTRESEFYLALVGFSYGNTRTVSVYWDRCYSRLERQAGGGFDEAFTPVCPGAGVPSQVGPGQLLESAFSIKAAHVSGVFPQFSGPPRSGYYRLSLQFYAGIDPTTGAGINPLPLSEGRSNLFWLAFP